MTQDEMTEDERIGFWGRMVAALPMRAALATVAVVWLLGCVWSFQEQSDFAADKGFVFPHLLPLVIDGFAVAMAGVAWAASLDARPAVPARLATVVAVAASSVSNGVWAWLRADHDLVTVVIAVAVPIAANLAFEVLLAELRRQVQRRRGLPPPVAVPYPRLIRLVLSPFRTFAEWRRLVLELTALEHQVATPAPGPASGAALQVGPPAAAPAPALAGAEQPERKAIEQRPVPRPRARLAISAPAKPAKRTAGRPDRSAQLPAELVEAGREIAAELDRTGVPLTRKALLHGVADDRGGVRVAGLRGREVSCSTDRAGALLERLRTEKPTNAGGAGDGAVPVSGGRRVLEGVS